MSHETNLNTLGFIETTGVALAAAQTLATKVAEEEQKVAILVPQQVKELRAGAHITDQEKQAAHDQLFTHEGALRIVGNLLQIQAETKQACDQRLAAAGLGQAVPSTEGDGRQKVAQADSPGLVNDDLNAGGYIGARSGGGLRPSDLALMKVANIGPGSRRINQS